MGVERRRPMLPAPTESIVETTASMTNTDLATDVSRRTDKTSYSIPDDGSPITITTHHRSPRRGDGVSKTKLSRSSHQSQTSLLIEYFEGGKNGSGLNSRPSIRVKVSPSAARKLRDHPETIQISEGGKKSGYTRRISLSSHSKPRAITEGSDDQSASSDDHEEGTPTRRPPVEIELVDRDQNSELSADRYLPPTSEISSMPPDSMLDGSLASGPRRKRSQSLERTDDGKPKDLLKAPSRQRSRSLSRERIAYRVAQKLNAGDVPRDLETKPLKKRSQKSHDEEPPTAESSLLSGSGVSSHSRQKSGDTYSLRSGSSLTNPKLLETVEDAIRRLILPELKELKKDQKVSANKSKFERDIAALNASTEAESKDELGRRLSKHSSAPEVRKSSVSKSSKEALNLVAEERRRRRERRRERDASDSPDSPEVPHIYVRKGSRPENKRELTEEEMLRRQRSKGLRDAAAAGIVGNALTAAALKHHDSKTSMDNDKKERKKRKSKSRSSLASIKDDDTELVFQKHNVPPMPMRSEIDSELTRESILSHRTEETVTRGEVARNLPQHVDSQTPAGTPPKGRGESLSPKTREPDHDYHHDDHDDSTVEAVAAAAAANLGHWDGTETPVPAEHEASRALSPIQSVASDNDLAPQEEDDGNDADQSSDARERRYSIESLTSAPSTDLARSTRQQNSHESRSEIFQPNNNSGTDLGYEDTRDLSEQGDSRENDSNSQRERKGSDDRRGSSDSDPAARPISEGKAANPQFVHSPIGVESAVASLLEPSALGTNKSVQSPAQSQADSPVRSAAGTPAPETIDRGIQAGQEETPVRNEYANHDQRSFLNRMGGASPPQSVAQSDDIDGQHLEDHIAGDRSLEEDESEINTNPSIIQGPSREQWPFNPTANNLSGQHDMGATMGAGLGIADPHYGYDSGYGNSRGLYMNGNIFSTPPNAKDEGYMSAANPMSDSVPTPEPRTKFSTLEHDQPPLLFDNADLENDPMFKNRERHFSGYSQGMGSPLYDSATGRGIDRIQSKDIIALMDHLTVRDAQRNARDTEILVTLVRSAAEMRQSFEEMKRFIAQQDELLLREQNERFQRVIGGPRPLPTKGRQSTERGEDIQEKRRNMFRRALKSLSLKSSNDLSKIEDMLEQLLDEVEALRAAQEGRNMASGPTTQPGSINNSNGGLTPGSYRDGYERDGQAGTGSPGDQSNSSRHLAEVRPLNVRHNSGNNRIGTVPEANEEDDDKYDRPLLDRETPYDERMDSADGRGLGRPDQTPPQQQQGPSVESTPRKSDEKSRKFKSSSSSFFPKISRWSKTTASSVGENIRNTIQPNRKERPMSDASHSGSELHGPYNTADHYDPNGDDRLRSRLTLNNDQQHNQDDRPPSPLVPSQVSEGPKYKAHRDSVNLQHPQPRQGPTDRFQNQLESQAHHFTAPMSPASDHWGAGSNRYSASAGGRLTPISDAGYSDRSSIRSSKIKDDGPLVPPRPKTQDGDNHSFTERYRSGGRLSPNPNLAPPPQRKPTGPRPLTSAGRQSPANIQRQRYRGSPNPIDYDRDTF